jgi:hypothetical protein
MTLSGSILGCLNISWASLTLGAKNMALNKKTIILIFLSLLALMFLISGGYILYADEVAPNPDTIGKPATGWLKIAFGYHMACWMLMGMVANYFWDLFRADKSLQDAKLTQLLLPLLVFPIVFYSLWSWWPEQKVSFVMNLIAFQNGFFWQVVFSKAAPLNGPPQDDKKEPQAKEALASEISYIK